MNGRMKENLQENRIKNGISDSLIVSSNFAIVGAGDMVKLMEYYR